MSEKVQSLAASIYKEFERMIKKYDEDVVKELMPLVVGILENLDLAFSEKQQIEVEIELLRDDNEQLLTQYEREKQLRKGAEQKFFEVEDAIEGEKKELQDKVESLESIVRMLELKAKNSADHVSRLEDKETENKKEYNKLHDRYTELFRTHMDYMERAKIVMGTDRLADLANSPRVKSGFQLPNLRPVNVSIYGGAGDTPVKGENSPVGFDVLSPARAQSSNTSLKSELSDAESPEKMSTRKSASKSIEVECKTQTTEKSQVTDAIDVRESGTATNRSASDIVPNTPELDEPEETINNQTNETNKKNIKRNNESIFSEFAMQDSDLIGDVDFGADITGSAVNPGEYASSESDIDKENDRESTVSDNFFGMGKELENLILENTELLATKNALNVVKDDLIAKVDELTSELEINREEVTSLQTVKSRQMQRISELEENLKKVKEELEKKSQIAQADEEDDIPMAQRKRFTRVEMARVLMERNQYKERLMELQEAVRWTEMIRASREHPDLAPTKKKSSIWNFFSNLFNSSNKPSKKPVATVRYNAPTTHVQPVGDPNKKQRSKYNLGEKAKAYEFLQDEGISEKTKKEKERERWEQYKQVRVHVKKDDGRMQAYGWSLPAKFQPTIPRELPNKSHVPVPVPVYCRPLLEKEPGLKIWCAAGVNLTGGRTKDGGSIVGASVFYSNPPSEELEKRKETKDEIEKLNEELKEHEKNLKQTEKEQLSSLVWICTSTQSSSRVTVIDANNPGDVLEAFRVTSSHILCIASVPGAMESDYPVEEEILKADSSSPQRKPPSSPGGSGSNNSDSGIGGITFVQCATGTASRTTSKSSSPADSPALRVITLLSSFNLIKFMLFSQCGLSRSGLCRLPLSRSGLCRLPLSRSGLCRLPLSRSGLSQSGLCVALSVWALSLSLGLGSLSLLSVWALPLSRSGLCRLSSRALSLSLSRSGLCRCRSLGRGSVSPLGLGSVAVAFSSGLCRCQLSRLGSVAVALGLGSVAALSVWALSLRSRSGSVAAASRLGSVACRSLGLGLSLSLSRSGLCRLPLSRSGLCRLPRFCFHL
ncbi:SPAG9 [Acanthosepion pharaonis]|uniref:SPAG9 n=1 Tax=Acanthosepion pharaonis TaxID=158019 RepID=A0A812EWQ7_ACAPH|nr:SPAG9 [Sepia pharaonis]